MRRISIFCVAVVFALDISIACAQGADAVIPGTQGQAQNTAPNSQAVQPGNPQTGPGQEGLSPMDVRPQSGNRTTQQPVPVPITPVTRAPARPSNGIAGVPQTQPPQQRRPVARTGGMISLNFDDADVYSVVQTVFGEILRVNYIVDQRVKGRVTFRSVAPVPGDQVLPVMEVILRINGVGVVEENGLYRIVPLSEVAREPSSLNFGREADKIVVAGKSIIQVVPIVYLQSTEVVKLITPFLSANAVVLDVPNSNQIIVVDTDASVKRILQLIGAFDNETQKKKRAQVYVYPVQNGKAADIASLIQQVFLGSKPPATGTTSAGTTSTAAKTGIPGAPSTPTPIPAAGSGTQAASVQMLKSSGEMLVSDITKIFTDEIRNSIIILATPEDYETIREAIAKIDTTPRQVVIEGVVAEVTLTDNMSLGLAYAAQARVHFGSDRSLSGVMGVNVDTLTTLNSLTSSTTTTSSSTSTPSTSGFSYIATYNSGDIVAYVNALANNSKGKLLAAPHILVSDNKEARIQVGQQVPIVTSTTQATTTMAATSTIQYKDIGIILKIKPQVNESGLVALDLSQEVSTYSTIELTTNEKSIVLNKTEAATNLVVQDGHTIAIGGLIREDVTNSKLGIPFLNQIPLLGYLFGNTSREASRRELIILITPHVIRNQEQAKAVTNDYVDNITSAGTSKGGLKKDEVMKGGVLSGKNVKKDSEPADVRITIPADNTPPVVETPAKPQGTVTP